MSKNTTTTPASNGKSICFRDNLFTDLIDGLENAASLFAAVGISYKSNFPDQEWSDARLWLLIQNAEAVQYLVQKIRDKKADEMALNCSWNERPLTLSAVAKDSRRLVDTLTAKDQKNIQLFQRMGKYGSEQLRNLLTYLRTGAIYIDTDGDTIIADNAEDLLRDYCSVTLESEREEEIYNDISRFQSQVYELERLHAELREKMPRDSQIYRDMGAVDFQFARLRVAERLRINPDTPWRFMLASVIRERKNDRAKFYNYAGTPEAADVKQVYNMIGYLPAPTPGLRMAYPELYKHVPFRGYCGSGIYDYDTLEMLKTIENRGITADKYGCLVYRETKDDGYQLTAYTVNV